MFRNVNIYLTFSFLAKEKNRLLRANIRKGRTLMRMMQDSCDACATDVETVVNQCINDDDFEACVMDIVEDYTDMMNDCYPCLCSIMESVFGISC